MADRPVAGIHFAIKATVNIIANSASTSATSRAEGRVCSSAKISKVATAVVPINCVAIMRSAIVGPRKILISPNNKDKNKMSNVML